jgi:hypothetical protein
MVLASILLPWWKITIDSTYNAGFIVYPYIISGRLPEPAYEWQAVKILLPPTTSAMVIFTISLVASGTFCLLGSFLRGKKGSILVGVSSIVVLLVAIMFRERIALQCASQSW